MLRRQASIPRDMGDRIRPYAIDAFELQLLNLRTWPLLPRCERVHGPE